MSTYNPKYWFEDIPVLAKLPAEKAAAKLRELDDVEGAEKIEDYIKKSSPVELEASAEPMGLWPWSKEPKAYEHTAHAFGHIPLIEHGTNKMVEIKHAGNMKPDESLKNERITITLDRLRVADYPGKGLHHVLFDFYAHKQLADHVEHLHFNQTYRGQEGELVGAIGYPIYKGLYVGSEGVAFKCYTVNVKNEKDEAILDFLDSEIFQTGLKLTTAAQPAIAPLTGMAVGLTKMIASRNKNVPVQNFFMGLDFKKVATSARLAQGSYVAVQIPEKNQVKWDWKQWVYDPVKGRIVKKDDHTKLIPFNYITLGVSKYEGT
jgi:hypothetical protein